MPYRNTAMFSCLVLVPLSVFAQMPAPAGVHPANGVVRSYHDGGIRDIGSIGTRKIGCSRGFGNWYTLERQIAMGKDYSKQIESTSRLITDPIITEYIARIGQDLVRNSDSQVPFTIKVIDSDDINAFALPGGFFYVDSGLILAADNEAELAGVMAHEIAHVAACHVARERTRGQLMNIASMATMMVGGPIGYGVYEAAGLAMPMTFLKFSRGFESEADFLGVEYMYKAGYDPQAFTAFFERVKTLEKRRQNVIAKAFETHPQTPDRIAKTQKEINTLLPPQIEYKVDTSEFQDVKAELNRLENRRNAIENLGRPTLRRRPHPEIESKPAGTDREPTLTSKSEVSNDN
jgi:beta-barrel assembly-enhancing protease